MTRTRNRWLVYFFTLAVLILSLVFALPSTSAQVTETGTLIGLITNDSTGDRLAGVTIIVSGQSTTTNANGFYRFDNVPIGEQLVTASLTGYQTSSRSRVVVADQTRWNSLKLSPLTDIPTPTPVPTATPQPQTGSLMGLITDVSSGERLADVTVSVANQSLVTNENGFYRFDDLAPGSYTVIAEKAGYETAQSSRDVNIGQSRWNSLSLTPLPQTFSCPTTSDATFELIPILNQATDHPAALHGDLNLSQRGYSPTQAPLVLQDYAGDTDPNAPQLAGLFVPNQFPGLSSAYHVHHWDWACGERGCRGDIITDWPTTLVGLRTTAGQALFPPNRSSEIYPGGYKALVLYAEPNRLTLGYTREDSMARGYAVHLENVCVDPNLLALYQAQVNDAGFHATGQLPALRDDQALGVALNEEIGVAIRDNGAFMDPRSRKDWWQGY